MTVSEKIKKLRIDNKLSQDELADRLNVSRQTISKWENGVSIPDGNNIVELAKVFNVSTDYLLNYNIVNYNKKKLLILDIAVLLVGLIGVIIFTILMMTNQVNPESSAITINGYGIVAILFLILLIISVIILIKKHGKK